MYIVSILQSHKVQNNYQIVTKEAETIVDLTFSMMSPVSDVCAYTVTVAQHEGTRKALLVHLTLLLVLKIPKLQNAR